MRHLFTNVSDSSLLVNHLTLLVPLARHAATETKGVAYLSGSLTHDVIAKHSSKNLSKGVMVTVEEKNVSVQISLIIEYGCSVPVVTAKVQERVKIRN